MSRVLTNEQLEKYAQQGFIYPFNVFPAQEAQQLRADLERIESGQGHPMDRMQCNKSYLLFDWADAIVHNDRILDAVEDLIGPNILCYMTNLFIKESGSDSFVSMHQDASYWGIEADDVVTVWVALSPASRDSGVMKVQPGSHKLLLQQVNTYAKDNLLSRGQTISEADLDPKQQVYMELNPGEASLHHFMLVHGSDANTTNDRRIGLAIRYVNASAQKVGQPESALLVRGMNSSNFILERRAATLSSADRTREHARALRRQVRNLFAPTDETSISERIRLATTRTLGVSVTYWRELTAR